MMRSRTKTYSAMTEVTLIDSMGTDLSVVNAARVSFNKKSQWGHHVPGQGIFELKEGDKKLIRYLAKHGHWTPFRPLYIIISYQGTNICSFVNWSSIKSA